MSRRRWACLVVSLVLTVGLLHTPPPAAAAAGPAAVPTAGPALGSAAAPMSSAFSLTGATAWPTTADNTQLPSSHNRACTFTSNLYYESVSNFGD